MSFWGAFGGVVETIGGAVLFVASGGANRSVFGAGVSNIIANTNGLPSKEDQIDVFTAAARIGYSVEVSHKGLGFWKGIQTPKGALARNTDQTSGVASFIGIDTSSDNTYIDPWAIPAPSTGIEYATGGLSIDYKAPWSKTVVKDFPPGFSAALTYVQQLRAYTEANTPEKNKTLHAATDDQGNVVTQADVEAAQAATAAKEASDQAAVLAGVQANHDALNAHNAAAYAKLAKVQAAFQAKEATSALVDQEANKKILIAAVVLAVAVILGTD